MTVVSMTVNGKSYTRDVEPRTLLVHFLRDTLGLTGTKIGCDTVQCGACTVHLNGEAVKSCAVLAAQANGAEVTTIEGVAQGSQLSAMQEAFWEKHGLQCGYCTPGMIMTATYLLQQNPHPSEPEIRHGLEGNLCRCTGYHNIVRAIQYAAGNTAESSSNGHDTQGDFEFVGHPTDYSDFVGGNAEAGAPEEVKEETHA